MVEGTPYDRMPGTYRQAGELLAAFHQQSAVPDNTYASRENQRTLTNLGKPHRITPDLARPPAHHDRSLADAATRWGPDLCTWLPPDWWRNLWERTNLVTVDTADFVPHGWEDWLHWLKTCAQVDRGYEPDEQLLESDQGRLLGLTRLTAHLK
ncbi:hypothetical protein [Kribbella shirazensis]|uniref:Uncharacterized protein n=1 Tax=Kribbella shirazensis TaxID=1105143 RepID=A0A7X5VE76_9ACTN|nr:hypothetical protein [Kribbella shirazensis]NIK59620.1 hypothetical protein [Kribbella shirazensis]